MRFGRIRVGALALSLAGLLSAVVAVPGLAAPNVVTVTPSNMQGWFFCNDQNNCGVGATGSLVPGPATPPLGVGSARLPAPTAADGQALILAAYQGTKLADIAQLQYSTFVTTGGPPQAIALQFNIDSDVTDGVTNFQGRLVFEPYQSPSLGPVVAGQWQTWNALQGKWWGSTGGGSRPITVACPQSNPCTWQQILAQFPNAGIHATAGAVVFKAGSGWSNFDGNVDALTIGTSAGTTTYNFEPYGQAQCKNGGWQTLQRADGSGFKNQGDCVSYTNTGR